MMIEENYGDDGKREKSFSYYLMDKVVSCILLQEKKKRKNGLLSW